MAFSLSDIWILYLNSLKVKIVLLDLAFDCLIVVSLFLIRPGRKISQNTGFPRSAYSRESPKQSPEPPNLFYKKSCSSKFGSIYRKTPVLEPQACSFIKKRLQHRCFPVNIVIENTHFEEHL